MKIFFTLLIVYILYLLLAMVLPFLIVPEVGKCDSMLPLTVYAGYCLFICVSFVVELTIYIQIKTLLKREDGSS